MKRQAFLLIFLLTIIGARVAGQCAIIRTISGPASVCAGSTGNVYTTESGMSNYNWEVSAGGTITAGGENSDNTVTVTWNSEGARTVKVNYKDTDNCSDNASKVTYDITVNALPNVTFTIQPGSSACINEEVTYTTQSGMTSYVWVFPGVLGTDYTITSGGTASDNTVTLKYLTTGSKTVTVNYTNSNGCTAASPKSSTATNVNVLPAVSYTAQPGAGPVCVGVNVTYTTQSGMPVYLWEFPGVLSTDYTIVSGGTETSNTVTLRYLTSGSKVVKVNYTNSNGCSAPSSTSSTATTINALPVITFTVQPGVNTCAGINVTYTTQSGMSGYVWDFPGVVNTDYTITSGGTAADYTVALKYLTTGSKIVTVNYTNSAGCTAVSPKSSSATTVNALPNVTFTIQPGSSACINEEVTYTTQSGMTSYVWVFPGVLGTDYTITSGGTASDNTVTLKYLTTGSKTVTVNYTNSNLCTAISPASSLATTVNPLPVEIAGITTVCQGLTTALSCAPSGGSWSTSISEIATVGAAGVVTGVSGGTATIYYTLPSGCFVSTGVTVYPTPEISTLPSASICSGTSTSINLASTVPSSYTWTTGTITGGITGATPGSGVTISQTLTNPDLTLTNTVQYLVTPISTTGSCIGLPYAITVAVRPLPRLTGASQSLTICSGSSAGINLLGLLPNTTSTIAYQINNITQTPVAGVVSNESGIGSFNTVPVTSANDGQLLRITGVTTTSFIPSCYQGFIQDLALHVDKQSEGGTVTAIPPVCSGDPPADLNLTGVTGYVVKWQKSLSADFSSPIDIPFPTSPLTGLVIGPLTSGTWFRGVVKSGVCPEVYSASTLASVNPLPVPSITGSDKVNVGTSGHIYTTGAGMSEYTWTVSPGGSITSGSGTNSITVTWNGSGEQYVRVNYKNSNNCSAASPANYSVQVNAKPVAVAVTILGDPRSGLTLIGSYLYNDVDSDPEGTSVFQWYTNTTPSPAGAVQISTATSQSYTVSDTDTLKYIGFSVIPHATSGASPGNIAISATWVGPVKNDAPKATSVSIAGTPFVNSVLVGLYTYSDKEGDIESSSQFQWYSGNYAAGPFTAIPGENTTTHIITNSEQGKFFRFSVIPRAATGRSTGPEVTVSTTGKVNSQPYADNVIVSGNPAIDSILTAIWSFHDPDGELPGASTFRWLRDGTDAIAGATGTSYKPTAQDEGKTLVFEVTPVSSAGFPLTGNAVKSAPTGVVTDASGNVPAAQEICIQGNRKKGALLTGKYVYDFYKSESGSQYRWLRNNDPIPGASGTTYTLTDIDVKPGVDITFEVTPVSSNYIPKVGPAATSLPLSRISLDKTTFSIADRPFKLEANVPGGFYSGKGVVGEYFDPEIADTIGSPHKVTFQVTITNTVTVCPQQAYDSIYVLPINPYFVGLDTLYCYSDSPATVSVANIPADAVDYKFFSPNSEIIVSYVSPATVIIDPSKKGKDLIETLQFSFLYEGKIFSISQDFEIVYIEPAEIGNLKPGDEFCNNSEPFKLYTNLSGSDGVGIFTGPVTGDIFDPSRGIGNSSVTFTYTNIRSGCFRSVNVPVIIYPAPEPAFKPVSTCIETVNSDTTWFSNLTTSAEPITSWRWEFFDAGGSSTSTEENPGYQFKIGGQHRVIARATTIHQCSAIKDSTIDIGVRPVVNFHWRDECYNKDSTDYIWFYDASSSPSQVKSWSWEFFDGNSPVLNDTAKYHKTASGYMSVKLKVETNYKGCEDSLTRQIYIRPTFTLSSDGYFEDFEGGNGGWIKDYESKNSWDFGLPARNVINKAASGVNSWYTNYSLTAQTPENSSIISPCFNMDSVERPMIVMKLWRRFDRNRDGAALQYKIGDDSDWQLVGSQEDGIKWYNSALIEGEPGGQKVGWTAGSPNTKDIDWVEARHELDELKGKSDVKFRIVYGSSGNSIDNDGIAFDDIWIGERTRRVLLEHFTNANSLSPDSKEANKLVNEISRSRDEDIINIQYHTNFPGSDPYYSDNPGDASARFLFYGLSRAPFTITDGGTESSGFATIYDYLPDVELDTLEIINRSLISPYFEIKLNPVQTGGILDINGELKALSDLNVENATLYIAVTEKKNIRPPINGEGEFYNIFRKFIPDAGGISLKKTWSANEVFTMPNLTWAIEKVANASGIEVIAFIQNNITKQIYQAESDTLNDIIVGIEKIRGAEGNGYSFYPNPAEARLSIRFGKMLEADADINIYDFSGAIVRTYRAGSGETEFIIDDLGLRDGIYLIRISSQGVNLGFKKLIIAR